MNPGYSAGSSGYSSNPPWEIFFLSAIWVLASQFAPATVDTIRDIYQANAIASGEAFPLTGPQLAHSIHLGPLWFYILAVPALVSSSWSSMALLAFLLSAMKFWLAYDLGRKLHSAKFGLFFALFLALPGWSGLQLVIWTHTIVLEAALLLYFLSLRRSYLNPGAASWLLTGLCFSLALHAHPTAFPYLLLVLLAWKPLLQKWYGVVCLAAGIAIPFLPYACAQLLGGFPDLAALQNYYATEFSPGGPPAMFRLLYSVVVAGPNLYYRTALPPTLAEVAIILHWLLILTLSGLCLLHYRDAEPLLKRLLAAAAVMLAVVVITVTLMRARTPWHLAYAPSFALAFLYAVIATIACRPHLFSWFRAILGTCILVLFLATAAGAGYRIYDGTIRFQAATLHDVKNLQGTWGFAGLEIPAFEAGKHGRFLCQQAPVVLHGAYAAVIDAHVGIEAEMSCGKRNNILIGGVTQEPGFSHLAGIGAEMNALLGGQADYRVGNVYLYQPLAVSARGRAIPLAEGDRNPPRTRFTGGSTDKQVLDLQADAPSALLVSTPVGPFLALKLHEVSCNGVPAELAIRSNYSWLYRCVAPGNRGPAKWQLRYEASADHLIDAVLLPVGF